MKKRIVILAALCILPMVLNGCQKTPETPVVVQKKEVTQAETVKIEENNQLKEELGVPDTYETTLEDAQGIVKVSVNAKIVLPDVPGFKLKKVEGGAFTQEQVDKVLEVLGKNQPVWNQTEMSKSQIEEQLVDLESKIGLEEVREDPDLLASYEESKGDLMEQYETAPETPQTEYLDMKLGDSSEDMNEGNSFWGQITVDNKDYSFNLSNSWKEDWKWVQLKFQAPQKNYMEGSLFPEQLDTSQLTLSEEEMKSQAEKLVADLGIESMEYSGGEYYNNLYSESMFGEQEQNLEAGYGIHFTRKVDGIPLTYTQDQGLATPDGPETPVEEMSTPWGYERLDIIFDGDGFAQLFWMNPYTITELSGEYVKLMPFSDIQQIFEQMILTKGAEYYSPDFQIKKVFEINEVRLGYMRIMEKDSPGYGTLVPVWDFFGTEETTYPEDQVNGLEGENYNITAPYFSRLTINAMDGTIINREYGY